ncbi:hypothetical protein ACFLUX_00305 [Chloroflexota bacterium]
MVAVINLDSGSSIISEQKLLILRSEVLKWFAVNCRAFLWRYSSDPYHIFIAEILLRQTQATRVTKPYLELVTRYPNVQSLSEANIAELRIWFKPLGLITRANHLVQAAQIVVGKHGGNFPNDIANLSMLPGIGIYGARAILCLGFGESYPMVDEGSGRVLRRVLSMAAKGPAYCDSNLLKIAESIVPEQFPKEFNLGLIDIAAACCHPREPSCVKCPLVDVCSHRQYE